MLGDIGSVLEARAQAEPERALFSFYDSAGQLRQSYTYGSFFRRANCVADALRGLGVGRGEPVLVAFPPGLEMSVALVAASMAGALPVPVPPPQPGQPGSWSRLRHVASSAGARRALSSSDVAAQVERQPGIRADPAGTLVEWIATDRFDGELDTFPRVAGDVLFIQYTSGSTSAPRGVVVTHRNAIHNAGLSLPREPQIGVSWLPHFHDMGLLGYHIHCIVNGGTSHFFAPVDFLRRPALWLELVSRVRATMTTAPNGAFEYCLREDRLPDADLAGIDLSSLRLMANCAEPVRARTIEAFWNRFCRQGLKRGALVAAYGLAEHTLCVTMGGTRTVARDDGPTAPNGPARLVSCGTPAEDVDIRIVDPQSHNEVADGETGEIWIDSPSKATRYWRANELSREVFHASIAGDTSGRTYLRSGDLGFIDEGELFVCGRLRDMLIVDGHNVFPADIEAALEERFPRNLAGRVVAFGHHRSDREGEELTVLVEAGAPTAGLAELRNIVEETCAVAVGVIARVPRGSIVRTSSGKIARGACRDRWASGAIDAIETLRASDGATASLEAILRRLTDAARTLGNEDATLDLLGLDSIAMVNLSLALEELLEQTGMATPEWSERAADMSLILSLKVSELSAAVAAFRAGGASAVIDMFERLACRIKADEEARLRADAAMPLPLPATRTANPGDILVTGATGFLGSFLLKALLERTGRRIRALVRAADQGAAAARLRRALIDADCPAFTVDEAFRSRIELVAGDLGEPRLGLRDHAWQTLASEVEQIYHCGGAVDYVKSYALLRGANVGGTREILGLMAEGRAKTLHHVSTTFIFGWAAIPRLLEADDNAGMERLDFGYAQSKWVAERLVLRARERGFSAFVYRPSLVTASAGGRFVRRDITVRALGYMIRHGITVDAPNQVSFLPVDVCAENIVALSNGRAAAPVVHMTSDGFHSLPDICRIITSRFGYPFRPIALADFVAHAHLHCGPDDDLFPLISFFDRNTVRIAAMGAKRYDATAYRTARDAAPSSTPHPTMEQTVSAIVDYLLREKLIPEPPGDRSSGADRPVGAVT